MTRLEKALKSICEEITRLEKEKAKEKNVEKYVELLYQVRGLNYAKNVLLVHLKLEEIERSVEDGCNEISK